MSCRSILVGWFQTLATAFALIAIATAPVAGLGQEPPPGDPPIGGAGPPEEGFDVGNLAPEIEGEDIDGVNFKLSDYRGKVVMIDFWGDW